MATPEPTNRSQYNVSVVNDLADVTVIGRVTKEPRFNGNGTQPVVNVSLAVSRTYNQNNEFKNVTSFIEFAQWGEGAERVKSARPGDLVLVTFSLADLAADPYAGQDGAPKAALKCTRSQMKIIAHKTGAAHDDAQFAPAPDSADIPL